MTSNEKDETIVELEEGQAKALDGSGAVVCPRCLERHPIALGFVDDETVLLCKRCGWHPATKWPTPLEALRGWMASGAWRNQLQ